MIYILKIQSNLNQIIMTSEKISLKNTVNDAKLYHIDNQISWFTKCYNDNSDKLFSF